MGIISTYSFSKGVAYRGVSLKGSSSHDKANGRTLCKRKSSRVFWTGVAEFLSFVQHKQSVR